MVPLLGMVLITATALKPIKTWRIEAEETYCLLAREFEAGGDRVTLGFKPYEGGKTFDLVVVSPLASAKGSTGIAKLRFGETANHVSAKYVSSANPTGTQLITRVQPPVELIDTLLRGTTLTIDTESRSLTVRIPPSDKARTALNKCQTDLIRSWVETPSPTTPAMPPKLVPDHAPAKRARLAPGHLVRLFGDPRNYPDDAREARAEGLVEGVVILSSSGRVEQCAVVKSPAKSLSDATCDLMHTVPFTAATDATGKAVADNFTIKIRWALPGGA